MLLEYLLPLLLVALLLLNAPLGQDLVFYFALARQCRPSVEPPS
jgi:hypothetical protein